MTYFDIRCGDDMDPFARDAAPLEVLAQDVYHWLTDGKFALLKDPDHGRGLESLLGKPLSSTEASDIASDARQVFADRISDATCTITAIAGEVDAYAMQLTLEVDDTFLEVALKISPDGIVRVS